MYYLHIYLMHMYSIIGHSKCNSQHTSSKEAHDKMFFENLCVDVKFSTYFLSIDLQSLKTNT